MSLRRKLIAFTLAFLATALVLGLGAFYIFDRLGDKLDVLSSEIGRHKRHDDLNSSLKATLSDVSGWALTGEARFRNLYRENLHILRRNIERLEAAGEEKSEVEMLGEGFRDFKKNADGVIAEERPVGVVGVLAALRMAEIDVSSMLTRMEGLHRRSIGSTMEVVAEGERIRSNMIYFFALLISFSFLTTGLLMMLIIRLLEEPYKEMLAATGRVASGDLAYRIGTKRKDEFGIIAERFDSMVEGLQEADWRLRRKLRETELYLDVARIAGMTPDIQETLNRIVVVVAEKLEEDICAVFHLDAGKNAFCLKACNTGEMPPDYCLSLDADISKMVLEGLKPVLIEDASVVEGAKMVCKNIGSMILAPIFREGACKGLFVLGKRKPAGIRADEANTASILTHTIANAIGNAELYEAAKRQLKQLGVLYELSRAMTSVYVPEELLKTIAEDTAKLINARGCLIRLVEEGMLKIKSFYGPLDESKEYPLPLGKGVAGWVAKEGKSLLIEDITKMPEDMWGTAMATRSAISVPLKVGDKIIGTLGLFDKLNEKGEAIPFNADDLAVAEGFASISAVAIDKAKMLELEQKREKAISEVEKRLNLLFETVQSGIITLDKNYTVTAANRYVERWIERPLGEIIGRNAIEVFHEKGGICPHCAAKPTFESGEIYTITQSSGLNYADLASYPVRDETGEVIEAVVLIQDITDRVLYQEEIMGLYREVMQAKEYIENLINSSADAIVTSDLEGSVKSWNPAAEETYGFKSEDVMGKYLPFVPDSLVEFEKENIEKIKKGEVLKLETFRKKSDGLVIEVSLSLSPIKDATGEIIGISGISRDITEKKRVEKELIRRNQELQRLFFISSAMRSTLDVDRVLRMILAAVTMGDGLGFNRAILFLVDEEANSIKGAMGIGPASPEEAWQTWERLSVEKKTLRELMRELEEEPLSKESFLDRLSAGIELPLSEDTVLTRTVKLKTAMNIPDVRAEALADVVLVQQLGTEAYATVPLVSRDRAVGVLWVDNLFNRKPITGEDMKFLSGFADQAASAIEAARLFQQISRAEAELENIFRSISDMVFFTDRDYVVKSINQAVAERLGLKSEQIVGRKCYKVFHGLDKPWPMCPHHKTVETMKPYVEELEDPNLKGIFLTSTSPIFDTERNFMGTVHVVRDITEIKELQRKLQATERMAALGEVAAKVAHEIRNPLVSVGGFARRLESKLDGNLREYAHIVSVEVERLEGILKEILGFVREARVMKRRVDLNDVVNGVVELVATEAQEKGNTLVRNLPGAEIFLAIDPDRFREAVLNILTNANQATDGGTITVDTYSEAESAIVEVSDTGCGIKDEDVKRIFDPFFTTRPTGTGLGLAIAKRIVEEHGGRIEVQSRWPGGGTTFRIYLPLKEEK